MLTSYAINHPLQIFFTQQMVHWQTDDSVGHFVGIRKIIRCGTLQSPIGGELADKRIEIATAPNVTLAHLEIEFVTAHAIFLSIDEDGEVAVVVDDTGHVMKKVIPSISFNASRYLTAT